MPFEFFQYLWDLMHGADPALVRRVVLLVVLAIPSMGLWFYLTARRKVPMLIAWGLLTFLLFGGAMIHPENRRQVSELSVSTPIGAAVLTLFWYWVTRRKKPRNPAP